jgi:hypothetical protein
MKSSRKSDRGWVEWKLSDENFVPACLFDFSCAQTSETIKK